MPITMAMLGGSGVLLGPVVGVAFLTLVQEVLWTQFGVLRLASLGAETRAALSTAIALYRAMEMTFWLLQTVVTGGDCPSVFVDLHPIDGLDAIHAMVVVDVSEQEIVVLDPLQGERRFPVYVFTAAWARRHNLALLVVR